MNKGAFTLIVWIACVAYCFLPDLAPGPLDDAIVCRNIRVDIYHGWWKQ